MSPQYELSYGPTATGTAQCPPKRRSNDLHRVADPAFTTLQPAATARMEPPILITLVGCGRVPRIGYCSFWGDGLLHVGYVPAFVHLGHARQVNEAAAEALGRAWKTGAGPVDAAVTLDLDSTICDVSGTVKQGAAFGYTAQLGCHPLVAVRAETGQIVGVRLRGGTSQVGVVHFCRETIGVPEREPDPRLGK